MPETNGTIHSLLGRDLIREKFEQMLAQNPNTRYCLFALITDNLACHIDNAGYISGIEYLGLAQLVSDFCDASVCGEEQK